MKQLRILLRILISVFFMGLGMPQAMAQKVLMITTNVSGTNAEGSQVIAAFERLEQEFTSKLPQADNMTRLSVLGTANALSQETFNPGNKIYDVVIISSAVERIHPSNWAVLQNAMANRWAQSFVYFVHTCCDSETDSGSNANQMLSSVNSATKSTLQHGAQTVGIIHSFPLNTSSAYAKSFTSITSFEGEYFSYINNVPARNAIYVAEDDLAVRGGQLVNNVFGLLIPIAESNRGQGACVFVVADYTFVYDWHWPRFQDKVGSAFLHATTADNGSCGLPRVSQYFDKKDVVLQSDGNSAMLTINLSNGSPDPIPNAYLTNKLPAPLLLGTGAATTTCPAGNLGIAEGSDTIRLTGFTIPTGGCTLNVAVTWPDTDAGRQTCADSPTATNTITPRTDFVSPIGQVNTPATASLRCHIKQLPVGRAAAIPTLSKLMLALTLAAIAALGMVAVYRGSRR
ncbi:hypothetical protein GCM10027276_36820 [Comamonas piscis]